MYQALYRKYRPKTFDEVCGQEIIVKTLKNTIKNNKITHAYLFVGPRGTGKTSIAKIFAKTINCENSKNGISCEKCENCKLGNNNENIDIIEMDAASNNGVDEIREIKNHVTLLPSFSKYKIYIIDEVHMLSQGAFNALLKTLEEPPKHVIFILATTEPQKVPLTILSRCQCYEFKPISFNNMRKQLKHICTKEKINIEEDAIDFVAETSNGGMRDAIGLLDQLNSYTDETITKKDVILLNGRIQEEDIEKIFSMILNKNIKGCFELSEQYSDEGKNFTLLCEDIIKYLRKLVMYDKNKENSSLKNIKNKKITDIIFTVNEYINQMKNLNDKKIYFDLLLVRIMEMLEEQKSDDKFSLINNNEIIEKKLKENVNDKKDNQKDYNLYYKLMKIRLNNILKDADKISFQNYLNYCNEELNESYNLDDLKIKNLFMDCTIKAGSRNGIIITTSNQNIMFELFENIELIEQKMQHKFNTEVKLCVYHENDWIVISEIYRNKKRNKENIEYLDENSVLNEIKKMNNDEQSEFDELIEIGEIN